MIKKDNVIGTRVSNKQLNRLLEYSKKKKIKISKLTRDALNFYINFVIDREKMNPIIIVCKDEFSTVLEYTSHEGLEKLAELCYRNSFKTLDDYLEMENIQTEGLHITLRIILTLLKKHIFSNDGQNWFEDFHVKLGKSIVILAGVHNLNKNFSIFIKLYFFKLMDYYDYELIKEDLGLNKIILHFQKREDKINSELKKDES